MEKQNKHKFSPRAADAATLEKLISKEDEMLKTLITISSALLALGVIFEDMVTSRIIRAVIILLFFVGLVWSFIGVLPFRVRYDIQDAEEQREQQAAIFLRKRRHLWLSAGALALGFVVVIVDLLVDVFTTIKLE